MKEFREKLRSESGIALIFVLLIVAILAVCASIVYLGFQQHLKNSRLLFDEVTVTTAERVAKETYILDLRSSGVTYYYDGIHRDVIDASTVKGKVNLTGYGRCYESENLKGETGAAGIPNKGENGGPQILAVSVEEDGTIHSRWQGQWLTGYDYELMTTEERSRLTVEQLNQIDASLIYELGREEELTESQTETESEASTETLSEASTEESSKPVEETDVKAGHETGQ